MSKTTTIASWPCSLVEHDYVGGALTPLPEGERATVVFADPPYNLGIQYADDPTGDNLDDEAYRELTGMAISDLLGCAKPGATFWWMTPEEHADWTGDMLTRYVGPRLHRIVWHEPFSQYQGDRSLTKDYRFIFCHRMTTRDGVVKFNPDAIRVPSIRQQMGDKRANPRGRVPGTTWRFASGMSVDQLAEDLLLRLHDDMTDEQRMELVKSALTTSFQITPSDVWKFRRLQGTSTDRVDWHPCQLPPELLRRIVLGWSDEGDVVLDAFAGSGSMAKVCRSLNRRFVGVDRSPSYVARMAEELA